MMPVCCVLPTACCLEAALEPFPGFRQELFDKLYDFFHRYFSPNEKQGIDLMSRKGDRSEGHCQVH